MPVPMVPPQPRRHLARDGYFYEVALAPIEGRRGVDPSGSALVFTREVDGAVVTIRVPRGTDPGWLTGSELDDLLAQAR